MDNEGDGGKTLKVMTDEALIRVKGSIDKMTRAELDDHWNWATAEGEGSSRKDVEECFAAAKSSYIFVLDRTFKCLRKTQGSGSGSSSGVARGKSLSSSSRAQTDMATENAGKKKISDLFIEDPVKTLWSPSKKMRGAGTDRDQESLESEVPQRQQRDSDKNKTLQKTKNPEMTRRRSHNRFFTFTVKKNIAPIKQAETKTGEEEVIDFEDVTLPNSGEGQQRHVTQQVKQCKEGREREEGELGREKESPVVVAEAAKQIEIGVKVIDLTEEEVIDPDPGDQNKGNGTPQMMETDTQRGKDAESGNKTLETNRSNFTEFRWDNPYRTASPGFFASFINFGKWQKKTTSKIDQHRALSLDPIPAEQVKVIPCQGCNNSDNNNNYEEGLCAADSAENDDVSFFDFADLTGGEEGKQFTLPLEVLHSSKYEARIWRRKQLLREQHPINSTKGIRKNKQRLADGSGRFEKLQAFMDLHDRERKILEEMPEELQIHLFHITESRIAELRQMSAIRRAKYDALVVERFERALNKSSNNK